MKLGMSEATDVSLYPSISISVTCNANLCSKRSMFVLNAIDRSIYWSTLWYLPFGFIYSLMPRQEAGVNNPRELRISQSTWKHSDDECLCVRVDLSIYLYVCLCLGLSVCLLVSLCLSLGLRYDVCWLLTPLKVTTVVVVFGCPSFASVA